MRYFDTAPHYGLGLAERRLAEGARRAATGTSLSTKVGRPASSRARDPSEGYAVPATHGACATTAATACCASLESSLERLGVDRVDVVFVHDPDDHEREALEGAFPALEELRAEGVIASYGAGMNQAEMLARFVRETDLDVSCSPGATRCSSRARSTTCCPSASGAACPSSPPACSTPACWPRERPRDGATYDYEPAPAELLARVHRIADVLERHGTSLPVAAAQFALAHPAVATLCLGARSAAQVRAQRRAARRAGPGRRLGRALQRRPAAPSSTHPDRSGGIVTGS